MRRIGLYLVVIVVLGSGMACSPAAPAGAPLPDDLGLPVPAGSYTGEFPVRTRVLLNGLTLADQTDTTPFTQAFGADGLPVTDAGAPMVVGYTYQQNVPGATITMTVTSIQPVGNSIAVDFDATMAFDTAGQQVTLTGTATFAFTPKVDGSLYTTANWDVGSGSSPSIQVLIDGSGLLSR